MRLSSSSLKLLDAITYMDKNMNAPMSDLQPLRVWDLPTRVFHWLLALCVISLIISGSIGGNAMIWHMKLGYVALTLLLFRVAWGFVGGHWSRFVQFFYSPLTILRYLRGQSKTEHDVGHSPLGSLSVWGLLVVLGAQIATGLVSDDEIATQGPLVKFVSGSLSLFATSYHKHWGKAIIIALVFLHIAAILFYLFKKKQNLIIPMLKGDKNLPATDAKALPASNDETAQRITALVIFVAIALVVSYGVQRFG
jgi:cytochrome b